MTLSKRAFALFILATFVAAAASASYRLVLQSGHEDLPVAVEWHEKTRTVVSIGEDGRLIVTKPSDGLVLHRFRVANDTVRTFAVNPAEDRAAVVTGGADGFTVSVWDWSDEELIYSYELETEPLFLVWSAKGRYLTIGNLGTPTMVVLEGRTGRRLSYLQRLPSLYNDAYIGSTETIIMTYASSGALRYWDIRSSALKLSAETVSNLQGITVLQIGSKSTLFAYRNEALYLINRQTGAVMDQLDIPGLVDVSVDAVTGELEALSANLVGSSLHKFDVSTERFVPRSSSVDPAVDMTPIALDPALKPVKILRRSGTTYLLTSGGVLYSDADDSVSPVIEDKIWRPDSIAFDGASIYIANGSEVQRFTSPFFAEDSKSDTTDLNELTRDDRKLGTTAVDTGLTPLGNGELALWDKSGATGGTAIRKFSFGSVEETIFPTLGIVQKFTLLPDGNFMTVDRNGAVVFFNGESGDQISRYTALGVLDAVYSAEGDYVLAGRSSAGRAGTPLEQIDMGTGEAVPVSDDRFMVYTAVEAPDGLYTIGVRRESGNVSETVLMKHENKRPERSREVLKVDGEVLRAFIYPNPSGSGFFTNLSGEVQLINGSRKTEFAWNEPVAQVAARGEVLYGLDGDGALVLWNAKTGGALLRVYFFEGGDWIALPPDGEKIWASPGAINNVVLYKNGRPVDPKRVSAGARIGSPAL